MKENLQQQLELLPNRTGVYKFYNSEGDLLYIGKALNLRARVSSYFKDTHQDRPHIIPMIPLIESVQFIEAENEVEALVLESALIKQHQPKYNVEQKDDKSYAWVYISTRDQFPTVKIIRNLKQEQYNNGRLFGPYPSSRAARQLFRYIRKMFPFCTDNNPKEPCLYVHLGLCNGPYFGYVTREQYMENINGIIKFLEGKRKRYISELEKKMAEYSAEMDFEKAAELRDKITDLKHLGNKSRIGYNITESDYRENRKAILKKELSTLSEDLGIGPISRIECYDISNIQGKLAYGSMTVSIDGDPESSQYRIFKIRSKDSPDDFAMHHEVLKRRLSYLGSKLTDDLSLSTKPDIILIDGGKGQLSAVRELIPPDIFLLGISKGRYLRKQGKRLADEFWIVRGSVTLQIKLRNPRILITLRDEAHRFALRHHRKARKFYQEKSVLDQVKGIGPKRKKALIKRFGSLQAIKQASKEELLEVLKDAKLVETLCANL